MMVSAVGARASDAGRVLANEREQVECDESGAVGERLKRPWEEQWAKGPEVSGGSS